MADYLTTYKFPARRYEEGGSDPSQQTSTKISTMKAWMKVDQHIPGEGFSLKSTWDTVTAYMNIYLWIIICPRHWPPDRLRRWTELNLAGKPVVVGDCKRWKYFMWTSSADATAIRSIFTGGMVENCAHSICISRRRSIADAPGTVQHFQLQPTTTSQLGRRGYENQALYGLYRYMRS